MFLKIFFKPMSLEHPLTFPKKKELTSSITKKTENIYKELLNIQKKKKKIQKAVLLNI